MTQEKKGEEVKLITDSMDRVEQLQELVLDREIGVP